jgi:SAM-dependent methyltransferase
MAAAWVVAGAVVVASWGTVVGLAGGVLIAVLVVMVLSEGKVTGKPLLRMVYTMLSPVLAATDPARRWDDVCALLDLDSARSLLDIGCGGGGLLSCALAAAGGLRVTGVDWSAAVAGRVRRRLVPHGRFRLLVADVARGLPFEDCAFDRVASFGVLPGLRNWRFVLEEMHRVLAPGGRLILGGGNVFLWPLDEDQALEAAAMLGFELQRRVRLAHHGEVWLFEKM